MLTDKEINEAVRDIKDLYLYFNNINYALEAFTEGYTATELKNKGNFDPYIVYLLWVSKNNQSM